MSSSSAEPAEPAETGASSTVEVADKKRFVSSADARFGSFLAVGFIVSALAYPYPAMGLWVGFAFAGYWACANDSIQTLGTFLASNASQRWWVLWLWIGGIFLATVTYSWVAYDGDVSYGRLASK
ncbi:MAG: hypothetical protein AAF658_11055, partial [Myxococcota bacterium]